MKLEEFIQASSQQEVISRYLQQLKAFAERRAELYALQEENRALRKEISTLEASLLHSEQERLKSMSILQDENLRLQEKLSALEPLVMQYQAWIQEQMTFRKKHNAEDQASNSVGMEFRLIPAGSFWMGSPEKEIAREESEGPLHQVNIGYCFWLQETTVTREQWWKVMGEDPSHFQDSDLSCPVENVSWDDCQRFLMELNQRERVHKYRLPSEAEWEYACRAGTQTPFNFAGQITADQVNYDARDSYAGSPTGQYRGRPVRVRSFSPSFWGLFEMHGNVWEWCADLWHDNYQGAPADGSVWMDDNHRNSPRIIRGGGWFSYARYVRSANRDGVDQGKRLNGVGLRVVRDV